MLHLSVRAPTVTNRRAELVKAQGLRCRSAANNDGDSKALLAMTTTVGAFPHWPVAMMATRIDAQLIKKRISITMYHLKHFCSNNSKSIL